MTARQISRLYFREASESITDPLARAKAIAAADRQVNRKTLRPLKDAGLITVVRPFLRGEKTPLAQKEVVVLTAQGAEVVRQIQLARGQSPRWRRDWLSIDGTNQMHASLLSDWYILVRRAMSDGWMLQGWRDDRDLAQLTRQGATQLDGLIPDAVFVLSLRLLNGEFRHLPFMLELDLGTESVISRTTPTRDWSAKIERYLRYFAGPIRTDALWQDIADPPRVLTLVNSDHRLTNLVDATRQQGGDDRFWFAPIASYIGDREPNSTLWTTPWIRPSPSQPISLRESL